MIAHYIVAVDYEIVLRAFFLVVIVDALEVGVLLRVRLKQELAVVTAPDLVKGSMRNQDMFSWNSHVVGNKHK